ncbi:MAG: hypothetical protein KA354_05660 [Phycisphaerae bacterium]|nr:hypothetical protein [Phycisphaerae bacterium]
MPAIRPLEPRSADEAFREAMETLGSLDAQKARIARMRLAAKLSVEQVAFLLGLTKTMVEHEWRFTRAWLMKQLCDVMR